MVSFGLVLLLVGVLLATLFNEARAASMEYVTAPATVSSPEEFVVDLVLPSGQLTPIQFIDAVVERQAPGQTSKLGAIVLTRARCPMAVFIECSSTGNTPVITIQGASGIVTKIRNIGAFRAGNPSVPLSSGYFGTGTVTITQTGYGYDTVSPDVLAGGGGYGYGYKTGNTAVASDLAFTQGYGYTAGGVDDLILRLGIEVSGSTLTGGVTHYLTVLAVTGSAIIGEISSRFAEFVATGGGGGGGGGGAPPASAAPTSGSTDAQATSPSAGASQTYTASFSSPTGVNQLDVNFPDVAPIDGLILKLDAMATNIQVTVDVFTTAPSGVTVPPGANPVQFLVITVQAGTARVTSAEFQLDVPTNLIQDVERRQLVLVHYRPGQDSEVIRLIQLPDTPGEAHFRARSSGLSPFALLADLQLPTVMLTVSSGPLSGVQSLLISAADNLKIDRIQLFVDGVLLQTIAGSSGSFNWDTSTVADGTHSLQAKAFDVADNEVSQSASVFTANQVSPTPTPGPAPTGLGGALRWVLVLAGLAVIGLVVFAVVRKRRRPPPSTGGPGAPPSGGAPPPSPPM